MKEVANTFNDSGFGDRVGLWNRSKVREGGKEGLGQESSLRSHETQTPSHLCVSLQLSVLPLALPPHPSFSYY